MGLSTLETALAAGLGLWSGLRSGRASVSDALKPLALQARTTKPAVLCEGPTHERSLRLLRRRGPLSQQEVQQLLSPKICWLRPRPGTFEGF